MVALKCARAAESAGDIQNDVAVELAAAVGFTKLGSREQAALHWAAAVADSAANPQVLIAGGWAAVERGLFGCIGGNRACFDEAHGLRSTLPPTLLKMVRNGAAWMHTGVDLLLSVKHQEGVLDSLVYEVAKAYMLGAEAGKAIAVLANSATPACVQCRWLAAAAASAASAAVVEAAAGGEGQRQADKSSFVEEVDTPRLSARPQDLYVGYRLDAAAPESAVDEIPTSHLSLPRGVLAGYVDRRQPVKLANHHGVAAKPHAKTCAQETRKGSSALNGASDSGGDDSGGAGAVDTILVGDRHPLTGWTATAAEDVAEQGGAAAAKGQKKAGKAKKLFDCTSVPWTLADLLSTAGSAIVTAEVKPAAIDVEFGPHALHTYKVKLSLADAVAAMSSTASALDMYVNIGADGPEESASGGVGAGRAGGPGGAKRGRTQAAVSPPSPYHPPLDRFAARLAPLSTLLSHALGEDHRSLAHVNLWLGAARNGSTSGMHSDPYDNVLVVLNGTKHIRLQDPSTATLMETAPEVDKVNEDGSTTTKGARQSSSIFAKRNKRRRHPQHTNGGGHGGGVDDDGDTGSASSGKGGAVELPFIDVVVGRGEALYIPAGWFHEVRSEPPSMDDDGCARDGDGRGGGGDIGAATPHHAAINFWFVRE